MVPICLVLTTLEIDHGQLPRVLELVLEAPTDIISTTHTHTSECAFVGQNTAGKYMQLETIGII